MQLVHLSSRMLLALFVLSQASCRNAPLSRCTVAIPRSTIKFEMVKIPAGRIKPGDQASGQNASSQKIKSIWVATCETTWDAYGHWAFSMDLRDRTQEPTEQEMEDARARPSGKPYEPPTRGWGFEGSPCMGVSQHSARTYCAWLSRVTGRRFRLPTEAEWEYACRAGGPPVVHLDPAALDSIAWTADNSADRDMLSLRTHSIGTKAPNAWGLHDMLGNVAEWVTAEGAPVPFAKGGSSTLL